MRHAAGHARSHGATAAQRGAEWLRRHRVACTRSRSPRPSISVRLLWTSIDPAGVQQYKPALDLDGYSGLLIRARTVRQTSRRCEQQHHQHSLTVLLWFFHRMAECMWPTSESTPAWRTTCIRASLRPNPTSGPTFMCVLGVPTSSASSLTRAPCACNNTQIPFDRFLLTWHGYVEGQNSLLPTSRIKSIGILMAERKSGPFYCQLEAIAASPPGSTQRGSSKRYTIVESSSNFRE